MAKQQDNMSEILIEDQYVGDMDHRHVPEVQCRGTMQRHNAMGNRAYGLCVQTCLVRAENRSQIPCSVDAVPQTTCHSAALFTQFISTADEPAQHFRLCRRICKGFCIECSISHFKSAILDAFRYHACATTSVRDSQDCCLRPDFEASFLHHFL